jgi:hypothetical protein
MKIGPATHQIGYPAGLRASMDTISKLCLHAHMRTRTHAHTQCPQSHLHCHCLVVVCNGGPSPSSGFPNCPQPQLPASHSNSSSQQQNNSSLTHWLTNQLLTSSTDWLSSRLLTSPVTATVALRLVVYCQSRHQAPWGSQPNFSFGGGGCWTLMVIVLTQHPLWREDGFVSYAYAWPSVRCT